MRVKVHLGSGVEYWKGWTNIDIDKNLKADIHADFIKGDSFRR